jgi:G:T-mismatch repair DNA endonuclease (very short patch repair protein)
MNKLGQPARYKHGHHRKGKKFPDQKGSPRPTLRGEPTWNKGLPWSDEIKEKFAAAKRGVKRGPYSEQHRNNISEAQKGKPRPYARLNPQIYKKGMKPWNAGKTGVYTEEILKVIRANRAKQIFPFKDTSIEIKIHSELDRMNIQYSKHWYILFEDFGHQFDIFIAPNILINTDGCFWHACPISYPDRDKLTPVQRVNVSIDNRINEAMLYKNYKFIRLWEHDINNNLEWCMNQITSRI